MPKLRDSKLRYQKRRMRIRKKIFGVADRPRLTVFRSARHMYAQIIDDTAGRTLAAMSTLCPAFREGERPEGGKVGAAHRVGELLAEAARTSGIEKVVFDRNGYMYHGRIKALAEGAREKGLVF